MCAVILGKKDDVAPYLPDCWDLPLGFFFVYYNSVVWGVSCRLFMNWWEHKCGDSTWAIEWLIVASSRCWWRILLSIAGGLKSWSRRPDFFFRIWKRQSCLFFRGPVFQTLKKRKRTFFWQLEKKISEKGEPGKKILKKGDWPKKILKKSDWAQNQMELSNWDETATQSGWWTCIHHTTYCFSRHTG